MTSPRRWFLCRHVLVLEFSFFDALQANFNEKITPILKKSQFFMTKNLDIFYE